VRDPLDDAIDGAVREMLDVEPAADLRARVMARLPAAGDQLPATGFRVPGFGFALAAAALIVVAVFIARREPAAPQAPVAAHGVDRHLPADIIATAAPPNQPAPPAVRGRGRARTADTPVERRVLAATADEDTNFSAIAALAAPASIDVGRLQPPGTTALPSFAPEPMTIRALEVSALPEPPRERREE
jgi:hypothetical protein